MTRPDGAGSFAGAGLVRAVLGRLATAARRSLKALFVLNLAACWLCVRRGRRVAVDYLTYTSRLYHGYGLPWSWHALAWRCDLCVPEVSADALFPDVDFTRSPELLFPIPRPLSTMTHELAILGLVVQHVQPKRVLELGTAEGRTTANLALHSPPDAEVVTIDLPAPAEPASGKLFSNLPLRHKITCLSGDSTRFDWAHYRQSVDIVFIDACDDYEGVKRETAVAFQTIRPGGLIFWHDYGNVQGRTLYLNELSRRLPIYHIKGTTLACLRADTGVLDQIQKSVPRCASP